MDEVALVRQLGTDLDELGTAVPAGVRTRVMDTVTAQGGSAVRLARPRRRRRLRLVLAGGMSAVSLTAALLLIRVSTAPPTATGSEATQLLHHAAQVALTAGEPVPDAGRFTFVESIDRYTTAVQQADGTFQTRDRGTQLRRVWRSVDGTQAGLVWIRPAADPAASPVQLPVAPGTDGYLADLPTSATAMATYLYGHSHGDNPRDVQAFQTAVDLLLGSFLTSAQQAAIFEAVARIPGITLRRDVTDLAGRHGVAVAMTGDVSDHSSGPGNAASGDEVIFDSGTGAYLGTNTSARLREAVVDRTGQVPAA